MQSQILSPLAPGWQAQLTLAFQRRGLRTTLGHCAHRGPLQVQRPFYPEGEAVGHVAILHPPGGVVGGDELQINITLDAQAHALITTPAAGKFYRSAGPTARQIQQMTVAADAALEWLPQENIVYAGAKVHAITRVELQGDARFIGWEILCLGRPAADETFHSGQYRQDLELWRDGEPLYLEHGRYAGDDPVMSAQWGLQGQPVSAALLCAGVWPDLLNPLRTALNLATLEGERVAVTQLDGVLICRYLGSSAARARRLLILAWSVLRPTVLNRPACPSRFWNT